MRSIPRAIYREEHTIYRDSVRRFVETHVAPRHASWEAAGEVPTDAWRRAGEAGILCCAVDAEYGGGGGDFLHSAIVIEELARVGASGPCFALHSDVVSPYIVHFGSEPLKRRWLPAMGDGSAPGAIAMSEPDGGSDLQAISTVAVPDGGSYVINGQKVWISNARCARFVIVACKTGGKQRGTGISLILVEKDRPGFSMGRRFEKIGCRAQDLSELFFNDCRVPATNLIGEEGGGFAHIMAMLPQERLVQAVRAVAACEAMLEWTIDHVKQRNVFGRRLADMQNTSFTLAGLHAEVVAQRTLVDRCLELHVAGQMDTNLSAIAKMSTCELQGRVADACLQFFGAAGFLWETPIARAFVDARQARIAGGTVEIMKLIVGRELLRD
jgi:acyl-CoA dehydrogenase